MMMRSLQMSLAGELVKEMICLVLLNSNIHLFRKNCIIAL